MEAPLSRCRIRSRSRVSIPSARDGSSSLRREFLSVVIPAYNEQARIGETLQRAYPWLRSRFARFEIIVVDDGSTDRTVDTVDDFASRAPELRLLETLENMGKGHAVRSGVLASRGEAVLFSDADLSTPIEEVEKALDLLAGGYAVAIASRALKDSDVRVHQGIVRETMGKIFNVIVRRLCRLPFIDTQCGFKCYSRAAAQAIFSRARVDGFAFDVETLVIARRLGLRVADFPVRWFDSPPSRVRMVLHPIQMLIEILKVRRNERRGYYDE
jgi:dolichyl-phosphate beta-glucosyltransferase